MAYLAGEPPIRWDWVGHHLGDIAAAAGEHFELTFIAVALGFLIAAPAGLAVTRYRSLRQAVLSATGVLYAIPSLALFAILVPFTGLTVVTAEVGLVGYTLVILIRNIVVGLESVPPEVLEAARGLGFRPVRQLLTVQVPLAVPAILAGVRIATVSTIGLVTVTALIGEGGLGRLILDGLIRYFPTPLIVGAVLSIALALAADLALAGVQRALTPWAAARR